MDNRRTSCSSSEEVEIRKGPWTMEEDLILMNYIATHGEGVWNSLAKAAGLKRTGKSCRLRWLNYLRPDVRRGNITQEEQILIMELHAKWGNRWSKIAKNLPGRTDNEIKNFWRTRIQKHLKQGHADDGHHHYHQNSSGQSFDQSACQSTSQLSSGSTNGGAHHDPYSASSYSTSTEHQPPMDSTFQLAAGPGGYVGGGGHQGYYFMQPPSPLPMDQEPTDQYWPHSMETEFWPMHVGQMFNPDQGKNI